MMTEPEVRAFRDSLRNRVSFSGVDWALTDARIDALNHVLGDEI